MRDQAPDITSSFTMDRRFRVWRHTVSHMTLLLRSAAWREGEETVDAWFDGVAAMNLHQGFEPLTIRAADATERARLMAYAAGGINDPIGKPPLYLILASDQPDGFVVCAHACVTATTRGPGIVGALPVEADSGRLLWSAGPTAHPRRHSYTLHEAGSAFLQWQRSKTAIGRLTEQSD